ncbi:MAG: MFS transporter [Flavobacteriales bacterium]|nr:MFS transporter [Flavobacteriales bacterium]
MNMRNRKASLAFIFGTVAVDMIGIGIIIPVIPQLIGNVAQVSLSEAAAIGGMMMMVYSGMQFFFAPVMGELSDRFGRRPLLLTTLLVLSIDYLFHAFAPSVAWLFVGRILAGISGASYTVANAYIADISKAEDRAKNFGLVGAAFGLGFILGPVIGGVCGEYWGFRAPFFLAAALGFLNFLFGMFFVPESLEEEKRRPIEFSKMIPGASLLNLTKYRSVGGFIVAFFFAFLAGQAMPSTWTFFVIEKLNWSELDIGISLGFVGILISFVQAVFVGWSTRKFGTERVIVGGYFLAALGMGLLSQAEVGWQVYAFTIPYCLGGVATPTLQGLLSNHVSSSEQGKLQGAITSLISISAILGPLIHTRLFELFTGKDAITYFPGMPFATAAVMLLISFTLAIVTIARTNRKGADAETVSTAG